MSANNFINYINSLEIKPDYNYTYTNPQPGSFYILKRSNQDSHRSFAVAYIGFPVQVPFIDQEYTVKKLCEEFAREEHAFRKLEK